MPTYKVLGHSLASGLIAGGTWVLWGGLAAALALLACFAHFVWLESRVKIK